MYVYLYYTFGVWHLYANCWYLVQFVTELVVRQGRGGAQIAYIVELFQIVSDANKNISLQKYKTIFFVESCWTLRSWLSLKTQTLTDTRVRANGFLSIILLS